MASRERSSSRVVPRWTDFVPARTWKPSRAQLVAATSKRLRDVIAPRLDVLFVGINPGLYSGAVGHHFARPGNRVWPTLLAAGFTPRLFTGFDDRSLLALGFGITNLVARTTAKADELTKDELVRGAAILRRKILRFEPRFVAFVGLTAYRAAFSSPKAVVGPQPEPIGSSRAPVLRALHSVSRGTLLGRALHFPSSTESSSEGFPL
jgi:TDG/mug DNA glycosylase family protein